MNSAAMKVNYEEQGMTIEEFYKMDFPEGILVELINGEIYYMASPNRRHQGIEMELLYKIKGYIDSKGGDCKVYPAPFDVIVSEKDNTVLIPDISVICDPDKLTDQGCTGAPDWVIEIVSPGNPAHDYLEKLNLYMEAGVREYWIVDPMKQTVIVYNNDTGGFDMTSYTFDDKVKVGIYDDLIIDFADVASHC